jgi:hypothetical protein
MNVLPQQARTIVVGRLDPVLGSGCQSNHNHAVAGDWKLFLKKYINQKEKLVLK